MLFLAIIILPTVILTLCNTIINIFAVTITLLAFISDTANLSSFYHHTINIRFFLRLWNPAETKVYCFLPYPFKEINTT